MALAVRGLGLPWVHTGIVCSNCQESPIEGFRYKCESCRDHNLCAKCYRQGHPHTGHRFHKPIVVDSSQFHSPFQLYYIMCHDCGQAPIEGRCHRHKMRPNFHLCDECYSRRPHSGNPSSEWEVLDEPKISTIYRTHTPVYHFHKRCGSCGILPIEGPRFDALSAYPEYSLCLICFDSKFIKGLVENANFLRIERPEPNRVRHVFMYACRNCGEVPIDGPAYIHKRVQDKVLCLLCFMNIEPQVQFEYSRVDAPAQYGEPPPPALSHQGSGTVSSEEYSKLAEDFNSFKEEKEAASRVVASNLLNRAREVEQLRRDLQDAQREAADHSNFTREEEVTRLRADYASLTESFEKLKIEKDEASREIADHSMLTSEIERLRLDKDEALRTSADYAQQLKKEKEEAAQVNSDYWFLSQKLDKLKEERKEEEKSTLERSNLFEDHQKIKQELEETIERCRTLTKENETLKSAKEDAAEYASLAKELERLDEGEEELVVKSAAERTVLLQEIEDLKHGREELTRTLERVKEEAEAAKLTAEQRYVSLTEEFENYREEKEQAVREATAEYSRLENAMAAKCEEHLQLTRDLESHRQEKENLESHAAVHADLAQKYEKLLEDKAWLVEQAEDVYREKEVAEAESAAREAALASELETLKEELDTKVRQVNEEQENLREECRKLTSEKESMAVLHASLVRRFEKLEKEKDEAVNLSIANCSELASEVERLKEDREEVRRLGSAEYSDLSEEVQRLRMEKDEALQKSANDYALLMEDFDIFKAQSEEAARDLDGKLATLKIEYESLMAEKEEIATMHNDTRRDLDGNLSTLTIQYEKLMAEKEEMASMHNAIAEELERQKEDRKLAGAVAEECERLRGEKDAAVALSSSLSRELEQVEAESTANYSNLNEEFDRYRKEKGQIVITDTPEYKKLLGEYENYKKEFLQLYEDLEAAEDKNSELQRNNTEQRSQLTRELENMKAENATEHSRLIEEFNKSRLLPSFDLAGYGKCAQVAVCTYGAFALRKKIALEEGYARSRLSRADSETLREAEKLIAETARDLDDAFEAFKYEAQTTTDREACDYYLNNALPAQRKKAKSKSGGLNLNDISSELAAARTKFGK